MILGIDQGTTGSTAVLLSDKGKLLAKKNIPFRQHYPQAGWVEHDPQEIWSSVAQAVSAVLSESGQKPSAIACIGITNQRETVTLFEGDKALHPFIVWQDRRTQDLCEKLSRYEKTVRRRSGTPIDPYFSSTKIHWLRKKLKLSKKNSKIRFRTIESFLIHKMTGADVIEATNAHRTQLLSLKKGKWDSELFSLFDVPENYAPEVIPSEGFSFQTKGLSFLPDGIPICAALGDQQAALFGQLGFKAGQGKMTYGTGAFILCHTGDKPVHSRNQLVSTIARQPADGSTQYALEGSAFICGAWVQWIRDEMKWIETSDEIEALANQCENSYGVMVIPALTGMGAPFWKAKLRGSIQGLTRGTTKAHMARASLEALAFQNKALAEAMAQDAPVKKIEWKVDGGAVKNNLLMQIQSDVMNQKLIRPLNLEATGTGVAFLAGLSHGLFSMSDIEKFWEKDKEFLPHKKNVKFYRDLYRDWFERVSQS